MRQLKKETRIEATRQDVWAVLADFGGVAKWAPGIRRSWLLGSQQSGVGARRSMRHAWGFGIRETVTSWSENTGYGFELTQAPWPMHAVLESWQIDAKHDHVLVTTTVSYRVRMGWLGKIFDQAFLRFLVAREMRRGVMALRQYVESNKVATAENSTIAASRPSGPGFER